jgi:hypothetical protein
VQIFEFLSTFSDFGNIPIEGNEVGRLHDL